MIVVTTKRGIPLPLCKNCGKPCQNRRNTYCGNECGKTAIRKEVLPEKLCAGCGKLFRPRRRHGSRGQKYCGSACGSKYGGLGGRLPPEEIARRLAQEEQTKSIKEKRRDYLESDEYAAACREKESTRWRERYMTDRTFNELERVRRMAKKGTTADVARDKLYYAVKRGILVRPDECSQCGVTPDKPVHGHHEDYSNPLDVVWLCSVCHGARHSRRTNDIGSSGAMVYSGDKSCILSPKFTT